MTKELRLPAEVPRNYREIVEWLAEEIGAGRLVAGERLPTHRNLAHLLGIAVATVSRAYGELARRGYVRGEVGRGSFVRRQSDRPAPQAITERSQERIDLSINQPASGESHSEALSHAFVELSGDSSLARHFEYSPSVGSHRHRVAGATWARRHGLEVSPDRLIVCNGTQHAISIALRSVARPGETVLTESVTNPSMKALARFLGVRLVGLPLDDEGIRLDSLAPACRQPGVKALYCIPDLQNPTGIVMSARRRQEVAKCASDNDVAIVENGLFSPFMPKPMPPIASLGIGRVHFICGFSKTVSAGLRIAYLATPDGGDALLSGAIYATTTMACPLMAELARRWVEDGTAERLVAWQREEITERRALARRILGMSDEPKARRACPHFWYPIPEPLRAEDVVAAAFRRNLLITSAEPFLIGRTSDPFAIRLGLGAARSQAELRTALMTLRDILNGEPEMAAPML
ncbi:MAG: PLP-dependent aminotransferase family protein [Kiloniellales bacterium]|nr:PLP-dependent aminotransferase family protein [Kiloniellales bacterium]